MLFFICRDERSERFQSPFVCELQLKRIVDPGADAGRGPAFYGFLGGSNQFGIYGGGEAFLDTHTGILT